jgi:hypothetical protein
MKKNLTIGVICVLIIGVLLMLSFMIASYLQASFTSVPYSLTSVSSLILTFGVYAVLCGLVRGIMEAVDYVRYLGEVCEA